MESVALTYAKALFNLSLEEDNSELMLAEVNSVYDITKDNDSFIKLLDSRSISKEEKKTIVTNIFEDRVNRSLYNFIRLLIDKSRIHNLSRICVEYKKVYLDYYEIKEAKIYSATKLSTEKMAEFKASLERKYDSKFIVENFVKEELIAGIKIVIGDLVIDGSVDNKLAKLKESIMYK